MNPLLGLVGALQFLTRIPIRLSRPVDHATVVPWFPLAGALIGLAVGGVAAGMVQVVDPLLAAGLGVVVGLAVTGAFHEDGLASAVEVASRLGVTPPWAQ